jgi:hypothetical protein
MTEQHRDHLNSRRLAHLMAGLGLLIELGAIALLISSAARIPIPPLDGNTLGGYALGATFPIVGWVIASRRPENAIGWIFLAIGISQALAQFAQVYGFASYTPGVTPLPLAAEVSWLGVWAWMPGYVLLLTFAILLFPNGHPPTARWRPVAWLAWLSLAMMVIPMAVATWPFRGATLAAANAGTAGPPDIPRLQLAVALESAGLLLATATALASVVGLVVRFRRSRGLERQQLKWFTFAGAIEIGLIASSPFMNVGQPGSPGVLLTVLVAPLLPVAAGVAILRHRLLDIDLVIKRTISYAVLTVLLLGFEIGGVLLLQALLSSITREQTYAVAATTLGVAAAFKPARHRIQDLVDRRFDRARYDAARTMNGFGARLRGRLDLDTVQAELTLTAASALRPTSAVIWLRPRTGR